MCAGYLTWQQAERFEILPYSHGQSAERQINPKDKAPVFVQEGRSIAARAMRWGLPLQRDMTLFSARVEDAQEAPLLRAAYRFRRCAIPVNGYYEENAQGERFVFREREHALLYIAGLYTETKDGDCFVMLTAKSAENRNARVPLLLYADQTIHWLESTAQADAFREMGSTARLFCRGIKLRA